MAKRGYKQQEFVAHADAVNAAVIGRKSGRLLATGGDDRKVNIWHVGKPTPILSLSGHTSGVESVQFDAFEEVIVAGSASGSLKIWDLEQAKIVRTLTGHKSNVRALDFHPYGEFIASGSQDTNVKVWDVRRKGCIQTYKGHTDVVNSLKFSPDGRWLVSASEDNTIKLWDLTAGKQLTEFKQHSGPLTSLEFHPNEFLLASGSADRTVKFWDLETYRMVSTTPSEASRVRCIGFHPDGIALYSGSQDFLHVYGWEPYECYDTINVGWGRVADLYAPTPKNLIGVSFAQEVVSIYVIDLETISHKPQPGSARNAPVPEPTEQRIPPAAAAVARRPSSSAAPKNMPVEQPKAPAARAPPAMNVTYSPPESRKVAAPAAVKPSGLSVDAFLPPPSAHASQTTDVHAAIPIDEILGMINTDHGKMVTVLNSRLRNIQITRSKWSQGNQKGAMSELAHMQDVSAILDFLNTITTNRHLWTLDIAANLLPSFESVIARGLESYVTTTCTAIDQIANGFGQLIRSTVGSAATHGVDVLREERYEKCKRCYSNLRELRQVLSGHRNDTGAVGSSVRKTLKNLEQFQ